MMKIRIFLVALFIGISYTNGQTQNYFEGIIIYKHDLKSKMPNVDDARLEKIIGTSATLFFKEGNYYHKYEGGLYEFDLYNKATNKMYLKKRNNDTLYWNDCGVVGDKIKDLKFTSLKESVLGIMCDQLIITYEKKSEIHYYNSDSIKTNPEWFINFKRDDEYMIDQREKSIFLKSEVENDYFIKIDTAIKVTRTKIDDKLFEIPLNAILVEDK